MITEDIDIYFTPFGSTAYYNGGSTAIKVIFDKEILEYNFGGTKTENFQLSALCRTADVPSLSANKTLKIGTTTYYIVDWEVLENSDLTLCYLSKHQA